MSNYLLQARNEAVLRYPLINQRPIDYFSHLLFCNGNGIEFVHDNPVVEFEFQRKLPYKIYYQELMNFNVAKELYMDRNQDMDILDMMKSQIRVHDIIGDPYDADEIHESQRKNYYALYNNIHELAEHNMIDSSFWYNQLKHDSEYVPSLRLSDKYYKMFFFSENTDIILRKTGVALAKAYIEFFDECVKDNAIPDGMQSPYAPRNKITDDDRDELLKFMRSDSIKLKELLKRPFAEHL